jgi:hypothetical protein
MARTLDRSPADRALRRMRSSRPRPDEALPALALQRSISYRAAAQILAPSPTPQPATQQQGPFTLLYMDKFGDVTDPDGDVVWRPVALDDPEFVANYVDFNIDHGTATVTLDTGQYDTVVIHYRDGRRLSLPRDAIPTYANNPPTEKTRAAQFGEFVRHEDDGFIYPTVRQNLNLSLLATPNLVSIREQLDATAKELAAHRMLIFVDAAFASIMSMYGLVAGQTTIEDLAHRPTFRLGIPSRSTTAPSFTAVPPEERPTSRPVPPGSEEPPKPSMQLGGPAHGEPPAQGTTQQQQQYRPGRQPHDIEQERLRQQEQMAEQQRRQQEHTRDQQREQRYQQPSQQQQGRDARTQRRQDDRYHEGAQLGLSREQIDALRQEVMVRSTVEMPPTENEARRPNQLDLGHLAADHRGEGSDFDLNDPQAVKIIVDTINEPQVILVARNGAWVFYKGGTVVVTQRGAPNVLRTAYGRGGRVTSRTIAKVRVTNPKARVGDPEAPVKIDDLVDRDARRDFDVVKIWP